MRYSDRSAPAARRWPDRAGRRHGSEAYRSRKSVNRTFRPPSANSFGAEPRVRPQAWQLLSRRSAGPFRRDDAGVQPRLAQVAEKALMLQLGAAVHHHVQAGCFGLGGGGMVDDAELHPDRPQAAGQQRLDRLVDNRLGVFGAAEDIDHVDRARAFGDVTQAGHRGLAEYLLAGLDRVDRNHRVAARRHVEADVMRRADRIGRDADRGYRPRLARVFAQSGRIETVFAVGRAGAPSPRLAAPLRPATTRD